MLKIVWNKFRLKSVMSYNSSNVIYVAFCFGYLQEYIYESSAGKVKLRKPKYTHNMNDNPSIINLMLKSTYEFLKGVLSKHVHLLA